MSNKKEALAETAVLDYLRAQNRPFSVNDIVQNLHKEHGKTAVQKALDKLVQEGTIREKTYGKSKIYFINQATVPSLPPEELDKLEKEIAEKEAKVKEMEARLKESQASLKALSSSMTTEEAKATLAKLEKETSGLKERYEKLSGGGVPLISAEERKKIRTKRTKMLGEWRARKKMAMSMINQVLESWPGSKEDLLEQAGVELDEEVGAIMPKD